VRPELFFGNAAGSSLPKATMAGLSGNAGEVRAPSCAKTERRYAITATSLPIARRG
jgi:hypothetical protein